jgi:hypothetical protein
MTASRKHFKRVDRLIRHGIGRSFRRYGFTVEQAVEIMHQQMDARRPALARRRGQLALARKYGTKA